MVKKSAGEYLTPKEVLDKYPQLEEVHGITDHTLGTLLKCHILWGRYDSGKRHAQIREDSVLRLIKFLDEGLLSMVIFVKYTKDD
ncbi:hypothetical protein BH11BAC7_BH11BAC7_21200 [soil metagenome]